MQHFDHDYMQDLAAKVRGEFSLSQCVSLCAEDAQCLAIDHLRGYCLTLLEEDDFGTCCKLVTFNITYHHNMVFGGGKFMIKNPGLKYCYIPILYQLGLHDHTVKIVLYSNYLINILYRTSDIDWLLLQLILATIQYNLNNYIRYQCCIVYIFYCFIIIKYYFHEFVIVIIIYTRECATSVLHMQIHVNICYVFWCIAHVIQTPVTHV